MRFKYNNHFMPPLRLILTTTCNGKCKFCHREGSFGEGEMAANLVRECALCAEKLNIPSISLTGGEPTMHPQLADLIFSIQSVYNGQISLTTNGYNLERVGKKLKNPIDLLNLSLTSFNPHINNQFQCVHPKKIKNAILEFPCKNKKFNIVIGQENINELDEILSFCTAHEISLDMMFPLQKYDKLDYEIQTSVIEKLLNLGSPNIELGCTSVLAVTTATGTTIRVKHPALSALIEQPICNHCNKKENCFERLCAVRVYPDKSVTPCLSHYHLFAGENVAFNIEETYKLMEKDHLVLCSLLNKNFTV